MISILLLVVLALASGAAPVAHGAAAPARAMPARAVLTWAAPGADLDLHAFDPTGGHGWYRDRDGAAGLTLSGDATAGPGDERFNGIGPTTLGVCWYASTDPSPAPITATLTVFDAAGAPTVETIRLDVPGATAISAAADPALAAPPAGAWCPRKAGDASSPSEEHSPTSRAGIAVGGLAARFRPRLWFDSRERWRPLEVGAFLRERRDGRAAHAVCRAAEPWSARPSRCASDSSIPLSGLGALLATRGAGSVLDLNGDGRTTAAGSAVSPVPMCRAGSLADCDRGARAATYVRAFSLAGYAVLDYWLLYRFNDAPWSTPLVPLLDNDHEGDWEGVSVGIPADDPAPKHFDWVAYAGHGAPPRRYLRGLLACDGDDRAGSCATPAAQRPHAYVARGTHASYPMPCRAGSAAFALPARAGRAFVAPWPPGRDAGPRFLLGCRQTGVASPGPNGALPEGPFDGARPWPADDDPATLHPLPAGSFSTWTGRWGLPGAVQSPARQFPNRAAPAEPATRAVLARNTAAPATTCDDWLGEAIAVLACDEETLTAAFAAGELGRLGTMRVVSDNRAAASAPGLAQLGGGPVVAGERVEVRGPAPAERVESSVPKNEAPPQILVIRALGDAGPVETRIALGHAEWPVTIEITGGEQATVVARDAAGRLLRPEATARIAPRPRHLRARVRWRRTAKRSGAAVGRRTATSWHTTTRRRAAPAPSLWIAFRATSAAALVRLLDGRRRAVGVARWVRTTPGGPARVWLPLPQTARAVSVAAIDRGVPGVGAERAIPARPRRPRLGRH